MAKFITRFGSYTLVIKPDGVKPIYDHKGVPVRVEGTVYCEFQPVQGTAIGSYSTNDEKVATYLRNHKEFGISFTELKSEGDIPKAVLSNGVINLPKSALMACNKNELNKIAEQYKIPIDATATKNEIVIKIMEKQAGNPEPTITPTSEAGGIKRIIQQPRV